MAGTAELTADNPALAAQADILAHPASPGRRMADAIRALAIDAVERRGRAIPACRWAWPMPRPCSGPAS